MMRRISRWFDISLQAATLALLFTLTVIVILGVVYRYSGNSLIWYDEASSMLLAWITFTGSALAMHRNAHLGFNGLLFGLAPARRIMLFWLVEAIVIGVFAIVAWAGWAILEIFGDETLTSLRFLTRSFVQAVLPAGAALMIIARLITLGERFEAVRLGRDPDRAEIEEEIAKAEAEIRRTGKEPAK